MGYKPKTCLNCNQVYQPNSGRQKFCVEACEKDFYKEERRESSRIYQYNRAVATGRIKMPGVGTGGNQLHGKDNPDYKNGSGILGRLRAQIKEELNRCERCNKSLINTTYAEWCIHHKDRDRTNQSRDNLELLCKRCHQIEHDCHEALPKGEELSQLKRQQAKTAARDLLGKFISEGATTISKESTTKRLEAHDALLKGDDIVCSAGEPVAVLKDTGYE